MEQVNEAINNETALVGTAPQKESAYDLKKVASTTSQKMMKAQSRDDNDAASVNQEEEDVRTVEGWCGGLDDVEENYDWDSVEEQIKADPSLAKTSVEGILPLHALSGAGAPPHIIKMLLEIYPEAAKAKCGKGFLPLFYHLALNTESPSEETVSALLKVYPGAAAVADLPKNQLPIHLACQCSGVSEEIFTMLLKAHPKGAYSKDEDGMFPVDYANANKDTAAKKIALAALLSNDPEEFQKRYVEEGMGETEVPLKPGSEMELRIARSQSLISESSVSTVPSKTSKSVHDVIINVSRTLSNVSSVKEAAAEVPVARSRSSASTKYIPSKLFEAKSFGDEGIERPLTFEEADTEVPVARSRSNASVKSSVSKKSSKSADKEVAEVPVARSRSNASVKSSVSKKSVKSAEEKASVEVSAETHEVVAAAIEEEEVNDIAEEPVVDEAATKENKKNKPKRKSAWSKVKGSFSKVKGFFKTMKKIKKMN